MVSLDTACSIPPHCAVDAQLRQLLLFDKALDPVIDALRQRQAGQRQAHFGDQRAVQWHRLSLSIGLQQRRHILRQLRLHRRGVEELPLASAEVRWAKEFDVKNRPEGDMLWAKLTIPFAL